MIQKLSILLVLLTFTLTGCEKLSEDDLMMENYYIESLELRNYTHDEVQAFGNEYYLFTNQKTELRENQYYIPTCRNISAAGYEPGIILFGDTEWKGVIEYEP